MSLTNFFTLFFSSILSFLFFSLQDPSSPFTIYVGDVEAAGSKAMLDNHNIKFVINCTGEHTHTTHNIVYFEQN